MPTVAHRPATRTSADRATPPTVPDDDPGAVAAAAAGEIPIPAHPLSELDAIVYVVETAASAAEAYSLTMTLLEVRDRLRGVHSALTSSAPRHDLNGFAARFDGANDMAGMARDSIEDLYFAVDFLAGAVANENEKAAEEKRQAAQRLFVNGFWAVRGLQELAGGTKQ
jgi:hypothetical protein